jgi:N-acetylmuramoyl-L-alanine amidase
MPAIVIQDWPLPYEERLDTRPASAIDLVVVHCTELPDLTLAREFGEKIRYVEKGTGNSGHYYVDRDGAVFRFVADTRVANQTFGYNTRSIGIELINRGRYPYWNDTRHQAFTEPYTQEQIDALRALLGQLRNELPNLRWIAGHEDLDRRLEPASDDPATMLPRRQDPGPLFPWNEVLLGSDLERLNPVRAPEAED